MTDSKVAEEVNSSTRASVVGSKPQQEQEQEQEEEKGKKQEKQETRTAAVAARVISITASFRKLVWVTAWLAEKGA